MSILKDHEGKSSSKRVMGIIYLLALLALFLSKEYKGEVIVNLEIFLGMIITAAALLGLEVAKYFASLKIK
jgi:hypothetical protein